MACCPRPACAPASAHCVRSPSARLPRPACQAASRASSAWAMRSCRRAWASSTVRARPAPWRSKPAAVSARCWRSSAACCSPARRCSSSVARHCPAICAAAPCSCVPMPSTSAALRCSTVPAAPSSAAVICCASALLACWCSASAPCQVRATSALVASKRCVSASSCCCTRWVSASFSAADSRAMPAIAPSTTGCRPALAMRALSARLARSDSSTETASCRYDDSAWPWKASWLASRRSCSDWFCRSMLLTSDCSDSASTGSASAWRRINSKAASRWWVREKGRRCVAMRASSRWPTRRRSRRSSAVSRPSMAEAATPATDVPKASPSPLTGAERELRMADSSVALSSATPVPRSVSTMPMKVPSMPSSTSRPAR